jgi:hypothetical protein
MLAASAGAALLGLQLAPTVGYNSLFGLFVLSGSGPERQG